MRRPSPLPQSTPAPAPAASGSPKTWRDESARGDLDALVHDSPAADPDGLGDVPDIAVSGAGDGASRHDRVDSGGAGGVGVGFGDVWRAARARRRALRAEVRRFTVRSRRRRAAWLGAGAALVLLVLGTLGAAYSPLFAVERVRVLGADALDASEVEAALADQRGTPLPLVDSSAVKAELVAFPLIESYVLEARPPHELVVRIVERTPIGVVRSPAGFTVVDAAGVALSTSPDQPAGFALLDARGGVGSEAFTAVGQVLRSLPAELRAKVSEASADSPDAVSFVLGDSGATVVWGAAEESSLKVVLLEQLMTARPPSAGTTYDISSTAAVVVR